MKKEKRIADKKIPSIKRRDFLKTGIIGVTSLIAGTNWEGCAPAIINRNRPNFLFIITDQQSLNTVSAAGCQYVKTPHMDRLFRNGFSFELSYCTNPLCSPSRSSIFTGRMPSETGVIGNEIPIRPDIPNIGQWLSQEGYETVYTGKWHLPQSHQRTVPGFRCIPTGINGQGNVGDAATSRACQGYLLNRKNTSQFFLVASFLQPHDINDFYHTYRFRGEFPYPEIEEELPPLPDNFNYYSDEPAMLKDYQRPSYSEEMWRFYLWNYFRQIEMVDAEIGRVLQALDDSDKAENTIIVFTSDHGEGMAGHQRIGKNFLYEESVKVPLIISWPGKIKRNHQDTSHLVSGLDLISTFCDYAGIKPPPKVLGRSLKQLIEGKQVEWHDFLAAETLKIGRMIRTRDYKYVSYRGDSVEQFFSMKNDPGETKNLAINSEYASELKDHRELLKDWEAQLDLA